MDELKVLRHARHYIESMSLGINPLNGQYAPDGDTISNERIQKCLKYVSDILTEKIQQKERRSAPKRQPFSITSWQKAMVLISEEPIGINDIAKNINAVLDENTRGVSGTKIASWLADNDYLAVERIGDKTRKTAGARAQELGITSVERVNMTTGEVYRKILYGAKAQRFIVDNIEQINE